MSEDAEIRLATIERRDGEELRVAIRTFRGVGYVDVRNWYVDKSSGEWRPGKGCTIRLHEIAQVASALDAAIEKLDRRGRPL